MQRQNRVVATSAMGRVIFGTFHLFPSRGLLLRGDQPVRLGGPAFNVLLALLHHAGQIVDVDELMARAWGSIRVDETSLRTAIAALRRAFVEAGCTRCYVETVPRRGYRFAEPVIYVDNASNLDRLPDLKSPIVGREAFVDELVNDITSHRLIAVVGPGGIGKTAAASLAAKRVLDEHRVESVAFVTLDNTEPEHLLSVVRRGLGIASRSGESILDLELMLDDRKMLIVLDSCERIVAAVARLAETILSLSPNVVILATSREPLRAEGERIRRLDPLPLPAVGLGMGSAQTASFASVELFANLAAKSSPSFQLTDETAPLVADICRRVDGIPLALEIAAARLDSFELQALAHVLEGRFLLQMLGRSTAAPRHQTLSATLDWSYKALSPLAQTACRRLSVFQGPFCFNAARHVVAGDGIAAADIGGVIACLSAKSLITAGGQEPGKHRLLNVTRAYLAEKLEQSGEGALVARRHAAYYADWNASASMQNDLLTLGDWKRTCGAVQEQVRAALEWASSPAGDPNLALKLLTASLPVWAHLRLMPDCLAWIARVKALKGLPADAGEMLNRELVQAENRIGAVPRNEAVTPTFRDARAHTSD